MSLGARTIAPIRVAFRQRNDVGTRDEGTFAAQWLACALPCQRFAVALTGKRQHRSPSSRGKIPAEPPWPRTPFSWQVPKA